MGNQPTITPRTHGQRDTKAGPSPEKCASFESDQTGTLSRSSMGQRCDELRAATWKEFDAQATKFLKGKFGAENIRGEDLDATVRLLRQVWLEKLQETDPSGAFKPNFKLSIDQFSALEKAAVETVRSEMSDNNAGRKELGLQQIQLPAAGSVIDYARAYDKASDLSTAQ